MHLWHLVQAEEAVESEGLGSHICRHSGRRSTEVTIWLSVLRIQAGYINASRLKQTIQHMGTVAV